MPDPKSEIPVATSRPAVYAAALWLALFLVAFFSFEFINDPPVTRWQLWSLVPELLDFIDPPPDFKAPGAEVIDSGWRYFPQRLELLAVAALILAGGWGTGCLFLRVLRPP